MTKKHKAFSLLEMSIVVIVIGILIAAITQGGALVASARIASARSYTAKSVVPKIDGLIAWYETSLIDSLKNTETTENSQISEWRDISPGSIISQKNKLTKTASSNVLYKSVGINNIPSLQFDGSSSSSKIAISSFYQGTYSQFTVFLVFSPTATLSSKVIFSGSDGLTLITLASSTTVQLNAGTADTTVTANNSANFSIGKNYAMAAYFNSSASQVFINNAESRIGLDTSDGSPSGILSTGSNVISGLTIGATSAGSNGFPGLISEVIIYNRPLKLEERRDVMRYLSKKYGITVSGI